MTKRLLANLLTEARAMRSDLVSWRRHLHMNPEPSMAERDTMAFVAERLRAIGLDAVKTGVGRTGVVGLVRGRGGKAVGLRADMDALELEEANDVPYRSRRPGLMHGCGHDAHVACLIGAAALLHRRRASLPGSVKLIFQPGEEGAGGARYMIADGVLERPKMRAIAALHVDTDVDSGKIGIRRGFDTAQTEDIYLTIHGKAAHAARPDQGVDAIAVASQALIAVQQFVARHTNLVDRKLITFGIIRGGTRANVLADKVELIGTIRSLEPEGRAAVLGFLKRDLRKLVGAMGARMTVRILSDEGYPPLVDDDAVNDTVSQCAELMLGADNLVTIPQPGLGGEDFAYFALAGIPAAMFRLGIRDEKKALTAPGHSSTFDMDDRRVLPIGAAMMAAAAMGMLEAF
ncbi:MAG: M20 family metallopeptidase [Armatimonadota bacterium]